jgi:hypothetical protein
MTVGVIDPDGVLAGAITARGMKAIAWRHCERIEVVTESPGGASCAERPAGTPSTAQILCVDFADELVTLTFASWNLISVWLARLDAVRHAA